jgi:hypothetical protein
MIVFGEVPRQFLTKLEEQEWIRDFVAKRGGGMLVIDGRRGPHLELRRDAARGLFPVDWKAETAGPRASGSRSAGRAWRCSRSPRGGEEHRRLGVAAAAALVAPARALPACEVLVEAVDGERKSPSSSTAASARARFLFSGFDESWRWRYEVADLYHQRYWNQVVREIMEPPFTVRGRPHVRSTSASWSTARRAVDVRARLRDARAGRWSARRRGADLQGRQEGSPR